VRLIEFREVGAKGREVISVRPEVVINHIKDHGHAMVVTGIDEPFETRGPSVRILHGERIDTVIAPVSIPGELGHWHELDRGDSKLLESREVGNNRVKGACGGERPNVKLVYDEVFERKAKPTTVRPFELRLCHLRWAMNPLRLKMRGRIWTLLIVLQTIEVEAARLAVIDNNLMVAPLRWPHWHKALLGCQKMELESLEKRGPNAKPTTAFAEARSTQASLYAHDRRYPLLKKTIPSGGRVRLRE